MEGDRPLSRREFEEVIRRAAELAAREPEPEGAELTEAELFRIAREVGLPEKQVRKALLEVRSFPASSGPLDRLLGPEAVRASRVVPGPGGRLVRTLDDFLVGGQLLQAVRRTPSHLQYRPAVDWASSVARAASATSRRYYVASAKRVEVRLQDAGEEGWHVEMEVEPGTRDGHLLGAVLGGAGAGIGTGIGIGFLLGAFGPMGPAVAGGAVTGSAMAAFVAWIVGRSHRKKLLEVRVEVEGVLDRLEAGEKLEPPPPSWRRWVRRHFHGVARDLLGDDAKGEGSERPEEA